MQEWFVYHDERPYPRALVIAAESAEEAARLTADARADSFGFVAFPADSAVTESLVPGFDVLGYLREDPLCPAPARKEQPDA